jgi:hypothetical protein
MQSRGSDRLREVVGIRDGQKHEFMCIEKKDGNVELAKVCTDAASIDGSRKSSERTQFEMRDPVSVLGVSVEKRVLSSKSGIVRRRIVCCLFHLCDLLSLIWPHTR